MKIPYGLSSFEQLRRRGYHYIDKTPFLPMLESARAGYNYLLFLRPRRFGKSLLVSMMEHYYDVARAGQFDELFGGLWVHEHPTAERNQYLVLSLDFSQVSADGDQDALKHSFCETLKSLVRPFLLRYRDRVPELDAFHEGLDRYEDAAALMSNLQGILAGVGQRMYVLIDEYDHFVNRLLAAGADDVYVAITTQTGFFRTFFATLKAGTKFGSIGRLFVTGVSPILLDDLSSGFNIVRNVSQHPRFNRLAGFSRVEVEAMVGDFLAESPAVAADPNLGDRERLLDVLERYYNGYRFAPDVTEKVFNSDMVLYFLSEMENKGRYPTNMLDMNVRTDYRHLQRIGMLSGAARAERRALLEGVLAEGWVETQIVEQFGAGALSAREQFLSLLFYMGMLTLSERPPEAEVYRLEIPNRVIRLLQWEHLARMLQEQEHIEVAPHDLDQALRLMAAEGEIVPFLDLFHGRVIKVLGNKDLRRLDEKTIKLMLMTYISLSKRFSILSEKEFAQGYCDLFLGPSEDAPWARYAWLLELKYVRTEAKAAEIERAFEDAEGQLARYASDRELVPLLTQGRALRSGALVFVGAKEVRFRPWPREAAPAPAAGTRAPRKAMTVKGTTKKAAPPARRSAKR